MKPNLYEDCQCLCLQYPLDFVSNAEGGELVDITGYHGTAMAVLTILEDASQASTEKLDVTIHQVASDSDTLDSTNEIATFTLVSGSNGGAAVDVLQKIEINLDGLTGDDDEKYLQCNFVETNTYEGIVAVHLFVAGKSPVPLNS